MTVKTTGILPRLFSGVSTTALVVIMFGMLFANFITFMADRKLQSVSLSELRMASWTLARLEQEANALGHALALTEADAMDPEDVMLRYNILWGRFLTLLESDEGRATRQHADNLTRLAELFGRLQGLEPLVLSVTGDKASDISRLIVQWEPLEEAIEELMIENFVGGSTGTMLDSIDASRSRMSNLRMFSLFALLLIIAYLSVALVYLRRSSKVDPLTGLHNFNYLRDLKSDPKNATIVVIEIKDYRNTLNEVGPEKADSLTLMFSQRLKDCLTPRDKAIISSPDEFVVIAIGRSPSGLNSLVNQISEVLEFEWRVENQLFRVQPWLGIDQPSSFNLDSGWHQRYRNALHAKNQGTQDGGSVVYYSEHIQERLDIDKSLLLGLSDLFNNKPSTLALSLVYQPIVSTDPAMSVIGAEVLLRAKDSQAGFIPPNRIVDLCERSGLGQTLGRWIFRKVAEEVAPLYDEFGNVGTLSINLNPAMMTQDLIGDVQSLLIDQGIPGQALCMEITEDNAALEFERVNQLLLGLCELGIHSALDDFGTGHSSLEYVRELRVDRLKVDRCFVTDIETDQHKEQFLFSILRLADQLYLNTIIEGVENSDQWKKFADMKNVSIQGYFAHKPMPFGDYYQLINQQAQSIRADKSVC